MNHLYVAPPAESATINDVLSHRYRRVTGMQVVTSCYFGSHFHVYYDYLLHVALSAFFFFQTVAALLPVNTLVRDISLNFAALRFLYMSTLAPLWVPNSVHIRFFSLNGTHQKYLKI
jgi:hypothetical protein